MLLPSGKSAALAVNAGVASATRKIATPASRARIVTAAMIARFEKIRSPGRRRPPEAPARIWPAFVVVSRCACASKPLAADRVYRGLDLLASRRGERGGAGVIGRDRLAVLADR